MSNPQPRDPAFVLRYGSVAAGCALLHNGIVIVADRAGAGVLGAAVISFCLLLVIGYLLLCGIAFRTAPTRRGFIRYAAAMACNFPLSTSLLWLLAVPLRLPVAFAAPTATLLMIGINFVGARWAIGRRKAICAS